MPWSKKTWQDRVTEYPNRRRLDATGAENTYDVARDEGNIIVEGDAFDAQTMNDLETRIDEGISDITGSIGKPDGIQPQTAARNTIVKADASGKLVAGTVYQLDSLFGCGGTPRKAKGAISLSGSLNAYNLIAVITAPFDNGYIGHYTNLYFPATFGLSTAQSIWGIDNNTNTLKPGSIRFGYNGTSDDSTKLYLAAAPGSCGIYAVYGVKFGK